MMSRVSVKLNLLFLVIACGLLLVSGVMFFLDLEDPLVCADTVSALKKDSQLLAYPKEDTPHWALPVASGLFPPSSFKETTGHGAQLASPKPQSFGLEEFCLERLPSRFIFEGWFEENQNNIIAFISLKDTSESYVQRVGSYCQEGQFSVLSLEPAYIQNDCLKIPSARLTLLDHTDNHQYLLLPNENSIEYNWVLYCKVSENMHKTIAFTPFDTSFEIDQARYTLIELDLISNQVIIEKHNSNNIKTLQTFTITQNNKDENKASP